MMIAAIHQPNYLPWAGYFYKIDKCDVFVFLDNVQYTKNSFINRNRIKTAQGAQWLTVGVLTKGHLGQLISQVEIDNNVPWGAIHGKTIHQNYAKAPGFDKYRAFFEDVYRRGWEKLADLNETLVKLVCGILGTGSRVEFVRASELGVTGRDTELLINICRAVGADTYLSGFGGAKYQAEKEFEEAGIQLKYYDFQHPNYRQLWGDFIPDLSIIDLLFNEGDKSRQILRGQGTTS